MITTVNNNNEDHESENESNEDQETELSHAAGKDALEIDFDMLNNSLLQC